MHLMDSVPYDERWVILVGVRCGEPCATAAFWSYESKGWYESEAASHAVLFEPIGWLPMPDLPRDSTTL